MQTTRPHLLGLTPAVCTFSSVITSTSISSSAPSGLVPSIGQGVSAGVLQRRPMDMPLKFTEADFSHPRDMDSARKRRSLMSDFHLSQHNPVVPQMPPISSETEKAAIIAKDAVSIRKSSESHLPPYTPQVENISPTPEDLNDVSNTDKDEILDTIKKVDREIALVEEKVRKLHKKKQELEESTSSDAHPSPILHLATLDPLQSTDNKPGAGSGGIFERIYSENRKKAATTREKLVHLDPPEGYPTATLHRQPWEIDVLQKIRKKNEEFKPKLIAYMRRIQQEKTAREMLYAERYEQLMTEWKKKVERFERHPKRIAKEIKYREIFEKTFPELKKQREERERMMRSDTKNSLALSRTETEPLYFYDLYYSQHEDEKLKLRQNAVLPPMMLDERSKKRFGYVNNNGFVRDPISQHANMLEIFRFTWSEDEKLVFKQKFIQYGKNFAAIAMFLTSKTTKECVQYYYLTKKRENYKQMLRRTYKRRGKPYKPPPMPKVDDGLKEGGDTNDGDSSNNAAVEESKPEPEYFCIECKSKIDINNPGRVLTRSCYEQYGLDPLDPSAQEARICAKCRLVDVRRNKTHCVFGVCSSVRRKVKPRTFPNVWFDLTIEQRKLLAAEFQMPENTNRCCHNCYKRLHNRIEIVLSSKNENLVKEICIAFSTEEEKQENWAEEEVVKLKEIAGSFEPKNWTEIAKSLSSGRSSDECRNFYTNLIIQPQSQSSPLDSDGKSRVKLGKVPGIEEEEEEEEPANSDEDTALSSVEHSNIASPKATPTFDASATPVAKSFEKIDLNVSNNSICVGGIDSVVTATDPSNLPSTSNKKSDAIDDDLDSCATLSADESSATDAVNDSFTTLNVRDESSSRAVEPSTSNAIGPVDAFPSRTVPHPSTVEYMKIEKIPLIKTENVIIRQAVQPDSIPSCKPWNREIEPPSSAWNREIEPCDSLAEFDNVAAMSSDAVPSSVSLPLCTIPSNTVSVSTVPSTTVPLNVEVLNATAPCSFHDEVEKLIVPRILTDSVTVPSVIVSTSNDRLESHVMNRIEDNELIDLRCESPVVLKVVNRCNEIAAGLPKAIPTTHFPTNSAHLPPAPLQGSLTSGRPLILPPQSTTSSSKDGAGGASSTHFQRDSLITTKGSADSHMLHHGAGLVIPPNVGATVAASPATVGSQLKQWADKSIDRALSADIYKESTVHSANEVARYTPSGAPGVIFAPTAQKQPSPDAAHLAAVLQYDAMLLRQNHQHQQQQQAQNFDQQQAVAAWCNQAMLGTLPAQLFNDYQIALQMNQQQQQHKQQMQQQQLQQQLHHHQQQQLQHQQRSRGPSPLFSAPGISPTVATGRHASLSALSTSDATSIFAARQAVQRQASLASTTPSNESTAAVFAAQRSLGGMQPVASTAAAGSVSLTPTESPVFSSQRFFNGGGVIPSTPMDATAAIRAAFCGSGGIPPSASTMDAAATAAIYGGRQASLPSTSALHQQRHQLSVTTTPSPNDRTTAAATSSTTTLNLDAARMASLGLDARDAVVLNLETQKAAYIQRQLVEQHFLEHRFHLEQQQQQQRFLAEHQQRLLMANDLENFRLLEQFYHQQQAAKQQSLAVVRAPRSPMLGAQLTPQHQQQQSHKLAANTQLVQQAGVRSFMPSMSATNQQQSLHAKNATSLPGTPVQKFESSSSKSKNQQQQQIRPISQLKLLDQLHATIAAGHLPSATARPSIIQQGISPSKTSSTLKDNPFFGSDTVGKTSGSPGIPILSTKEALLQQQHAAPPTKAAMKEFPPILKKTASITDLFTQNLIQPVTKSMFISTTHPQLQRPQNSQASPKVHQRQHMTHTPPISTNLDMGQHITTHSYHHADSSKSRVLCGRIGFDPPIGSTTIHGPGSVRCSGPNTPLGVGTPYGPSTVHRPTAAVRSPTLLHGTVCGPRTAIVPNVGAALLGENVRGSSTLHYPHHQHPRVLAEVSPVTVPQNVSSKVQSSTQFIEHGGGQKIVPPFDHASKQQLNEKFTAQSLIDSMIARHLETASPTSGMQQAVEKIGNKLSKKLSIGQSSNLQQNLIAHQTQSMEGLPLVGPSILQQIDKIIIGAYNNNSDGSISAMKDEKLMISDPQLSKCDTVMLDMIEPVTPPQYSSEPMKINEALQSPGTKIIAAAPISKKSLVQSSSFEYDLEPVSPPGVEIIGDVGQPSAPPLAQTPPTVVPPSQLATPAPPTIGVVQSQPFMAFNVFTLPASSTGQSSAPTPPIVVPPSANHLGHWPVAASASHSPSISQSFTPQSTNRSWPQSAVNQLVSSLTPPPSQSASTGRQCWPQSVGVQSTTVGGGAGGELNLSSSADDNESMLAVAALIETELSGGGGANTSSSSLSANQESGAGLVAMETVKSLGKQQVVPTMLPTYEPLSDDES